MGRRLAEEVEKMTLNQGETPEPVILHLTFGSKDDVASVASLPTVQALPGFDPSLRVLQSPQVSGRGAEPLTGRPMFPPKERIAATVLGTQDIPFEVAKTLIVETGPVELLQAVAKEPDFPAICWEPLTEALQKLQEETCDPRSAEVGDRG